MAISQKKSRRKETGGRYTRTKGKRKYELGGTPAHTTIGEKRVFKVRILGGNRKICLRTVEFVNLLDKKANKHVKAKIESVVENPANPHFTRRNIITKGAVLKTDKGDAIVTSRPGQDGFLNAVLK